MGDLRAGGPIRLAPAGPRRRRPDPGPMRIALGMTGVAAASAIGSALLAPTATVPVAPASTSGVGSAALTRHVIQVVKLKPGQTAPPNAIVRQAPAPTPRLVIVTTHQSGSP